MLMLINILLLVACVWIFSKQKFLFSPTSTFIAYAGLAIPGSFLISILLNLTSVFYISPQDVDEDAVVYSALAMLLGIGGLIFGRAFEQFIPKFKQRSMNMDGSRLYLVIPVSIVVALISLFSLVSELGGFGRIISELGAVRSGELTGKGFQVYAITMLLPTVLQWNLVQCLRGNSNRRYVALILCLLSSLMGAGLGFRAPAVALLIQTIVIWYLLTKTPSRRALMLGTALFIPLITLAGVTRFLTNESVIDTLKDADTALISAYFADTTLTRVRGVEAFSILKQFVDAHSYGMFIENISESIFSIVPGALIEKPVSLTENIATQVYGRYLLDAGIIRDTYGGVSYTFISEGYWNAGFLGVLLYGFIFGIFFKIVERAERYESPTNLQIMLYKAVAGFTPLLVEAPQLGVNAIIVNIFVNSILLLVIFYPITNQRR